MNCPGSGHHAGTITDNGLAYDPDDAMNHAKPALEIRSAELVVRFPRGLCTICHATHATTIKGIIRNHSPRSTA